MPFKHKFFYGLGVILTELMSLYTQSNNFFSNYSDGCFVHAFPFYRNMFYRDI